ncbi:MAG: cobyrinate a,c-diamide synthase [Desulfobacterales bacterium]
MRQGEAIVPGIIISALRGGAGKSILSIGIAAAFRDTGKTVAPFKKGPDYIDAGWLALAAGRPCYNLDLFMTGSNSVIHSYRTHSNQNDIAVVEGNRGLFDGIDVEGTTSTAEIAKLLDLPVVMCVDCTKTTRTMAAAIFGCMWFDPDVKLKGVVLNRVAGSRHESIIRKNLEYHCGIPVLGAIPKLGTHDFPERHMGLVPTPEHEWAARSVAAAAKVIKSNIDLDALYQIAEDDAGRIALEKEAHTEIFDGAKSVLTKQDGDFVPKIGVLRDSAFQFYYQDNLEALESAGAELVFASPITDESLPSVDALYIGGGFPETHADELSKNVRFREEIKSLADGGMPVYAECGGLIYLGERLDMDGRCYTMTGIFPIVFGLSKRPQGHGYTIIRVDRENPFFTKGTEIRGHEFRYSTIREWRGVDSDMVFSTVRGTGLHNKRDGIRYKSVLASYTHLHALGTPDWAPSFVRNALLYQKKKMQIG